MLNRFLPDIYCKSIFTINYDKLKKEGIKCILFDIDNTLSPAKEKVLCDKTKKLFDKLKKDFTIILLSNNFKKRVSSFADFYGVNYEHFAVKPLRFKYIKILNKYKFNKNEIISVGDQLLTDIQGGHKVGIKTILVDPVSEIDEKETWLNREIEKKIFKRFEKSNKLIKGKYYE